MIENLVDALNALQVISLSNFTHSSNGLPLSDKGNGFAKAYLRSCANNLSTFELRHMPNNPAKSRRKF